MKYTLILLCFVATAAFSETLDVPDKIAAKCREMGGCVLIPRVLIEALLEENETLRARQNKSCA